MAKTVDDATTAYRRDPPPREGKWKSKNQVSGEISSTIPRWGPNADIFLFYDVPAAESVGGFTEQKPMR
jgi:hypothetical protein